MKLITEMSNSIITESIDKSLYVTGIFSTAAVKNNNGRIYEKKLLEREVSKVMEQVEGSSLYGQLNHPEKPEIDLEKVAILVEDLQWQGNDVMGKAKVLESTQSGRNLAGIIKDGGKVGISSRGLGTVSESGTVNEDFNLICWDIVADASNPGSKYVNGIYEGRDFLSITDVKMKSNTEKSDAEEKYIKHIWQVLENITKKL